MADNQIIGKHKTKVFKKEGYTCVQYWNTIVLKFNEKEIILDSGGYRTATTKLRINQASQEFNLGLNVSQKNFIWYVNFKGNTLEFRDNMKIVSYN